MPLIVVSMLPQRLEDEPVALAIAGFLVMMLGFVAALVAGRLSLVLPPIALGRTDIGLGEAWRRTRGNTWRLLWGPLICVVLVTVPAFMVQRVVEGDRALATVATTGFGLFMLLGGVIAVGFLSFAYQHFFPNEG